MASTDSWVATATVPTCSTSQSHQFIIATAGRRPKTAGRPFTHWSLRKVAGYLAHNPDRIVTVGRERLRPILHAHHISFQHTRTWKRSQAA
jgi:hypothetical protein